MADAIVTRASIEAKARSAFEQGKSRDSHGMNWGAPALETWLAEYDRLAAEAKKVAA